MIDELYRLIQIFTEKTYGFPPQNCGVSEIYMLRLLPPPRKDFMLKGKQGEREDMGVDLYSVQQELARNQMSVEQLHDDYAKRQKHRLQAEQELTEMRDTYTGKQKLIKMERKKGGSGG